MNYNYQCNYCLHEKYRAISDGIRDWENGVDGSYAYYQCQRCDGVQLYPFPDLADLREAYDIDYHGYAAGERRGLLFSPLYTAKERVFRRQMGRLVDPCSRVLDVGRGAGDFLLGMSALGVEQLSGIDFSADMVGRLEQLGIDGFCGTFADFNGPARSYDLISMNNYLEHTLDPRRELAKSLELLRPGGHLVGEAPCFDSWERKLFGRYWGGNHVPRHTYQFTTRFLREQLQNSGYRDIHITHQLNTSHLALSVQNFLQRHVSDLRRNPAVNRGRGRYYTLLLLLFIPVNVVCVAFRKSGCIKFTARKPNVAQRK